MALAGMAVAAMVALGACEVLPDADSDGIPDAAETNTGVFIDANDTGTDPNNPDTDGDGLLDGREDGTGTLAGFGVSPVRKDLLVEFDWFADDQSQMTGYSWYEPAGRDGCGQHSHRPNAGAINQLKSAYAAAPVSNPDGSTGINFIADYGQGGVFTGGTVVADADGLINGNIFGAEFVALKAANFDAEREGLFHYTLMPHRYLVGNSNASSGNAWVDGPDLVVSLYCYNSNDNVARTIMHELGHNLGLLHGGDESLPNYEPNYNSVMNYLFQFPGVDDDCASSGGSVGNLEFGDGVLDYSTGSRAPLNENQLLETAGICNGVDVDWNVSGAINGAAIAVDINGDGGQSVLTDHDDWASLNYASVSAGGANGGARQAPPEAIVEQPVPAAFE